MVPVTLDVNVLLEKLTQLEARVASQQEQIAHLAFQLLSEQATQEELERAMQISQELGGLPLALDQTGAYLEETGMDLVGYWHLYQQHRSDLLRERRGLVADHPESVATTWSLSLEWVEEKNPVAASKLLRRPFLAAQ